MPASLEAGIIFLVLIAPGFLLQRGFQRGGTYAVPSLSLYAIAQAVVLSGVLLLVSFPLGGFKIVKWLNDGTLLDEHQWAAWSYLVALLGLPFVLGLISGRITQTLFSPVGGQFPERVRRVRPVSGLLSLRSRLQGSALPDWLAWLGFMAAPTTWDRVWLSIGERKRTVMIEVDLGDGDRVFGVFASESFATTSPQPPGLFLEAEYAEEDGRLVEYENSEGLFVDGSQIRSLRFFRHEPLEDQLWEEGPDPGLREAGTSGGESPES